MTAEVQLLSAQKQHLADLLEAIQRCVYFLEASDREISWPLDGDTLTVCKKDVALFGSLAAINERFAKLQDVTGSAMRHALLMQDENPESFMKVLSFYEKASVISDVEIWRSARRERNQAAHDYETDYEKIATHFNALHDLRIGMVEIAAKFVRWCDFELKVMPASDAFSAKFAATTGAVT